MVNKAELNTIVTQLRGHVKKAKVRSINKHVKRIRSFEHGKQKNPENKKLEAKIKKFGEEIEEFKKMHNADTMKKIFIFNNKEIGKVMAKVGASVEERAIAKLLFMNEFLVKMINDYKKKLNLSDEDKEWKKELLKAGKKKVKKQKKLSESSMDDGASTEGSPKKKKNQKDTDKSEVVTKNKPKKKKDKIKKEEKIDSAGDEEAEIAKPDTNNSPKKQKINKKNTPENREEKLLKINPKSKKINEKAKDVVSKNKDFKKKINGNAPHQKPSGKPAFAKNRQNGPPQKSKKDFKANQKGDRVGKKQPGGKFQAKKKFGN
ncbi:hypothetical protein DMENIID0001_136490 [Sergentomyia squamirostris]